MKLNLFYYISIAFIISSCGSSKKYHKSKKTAYSDKIVLKQTEIKREDKPLVQDKKMVISPLVVTPTNTEEYIAQYAPIAIMEMKKHKIPASITLAQGILESGSGRSELAIRSNNHFGIKCHKSWGGKSVTHDDDHIGECFRKYIHPRTSYEDHSTFLTRRGRYAKLFKFKTTDYKSWAYGLKRAGYATDPKYPNKIIGLIKRYRLHQYDTGTYVPKKILRTSRKTNINNLNNYTIKSGDTLYSIAKRYNTTVRTLKQLNRLSNNYLSIGQEILIK